MGAGRFAPSAGAAIAVAAAVAFDLLADEHPTHTISLGTVAAVAAVRLHPVGRQENVLAVVARPPAPAW